MEYRRNRSRSKKNGSSGGRVLSVLILIIAGVYLISVSAAGKWLSKHIVEPVFSAFISKDKPSNENDTTNSSIFTSNTTGEIELPGLECYLLQMGVFSTQDNANTLAREIQQKGGGGYVMQDAQKYRVFASGYSTEADARSVKAQLAKEGYECSVHELASLGAGFDVSVTGGASSAVSDIQKVFYTLLSTHDDLLELSLSFDRDSMTVENAISAVKSISDNFKQAKDCKGSVPDEISKCIAAYDEQLNTLMQAKEADATKVSSMLKYAQLSAAYEFVNMAKQLSQ